MCIRDRLSVTLPSLSLPSTLLISTPSSLANFLTFGEAAVFLEKSFTITFFDPTSLLISIFFSLVFSFLIVFISSVFN